MPLWRSPKPRRSAIIAVVLRLPRPLRAGARRIADGLACKTSTLPRSGRGFESLRPLQNFPVIESLTTGRRKAALSFFFWGSARGSGEPDLLTQSLLAGLGPVRAPRAGFVPWFERRPWRPKCYGPLLRRPRLRPHKQLAYSVPETAIQFGTGSNVNRGAAHRGRTYRQIEVNGQPWRRTFVLRLQLHHS